ncbi:MAG TPA: DinB family protein [Thermoanaerobaculia bacterium]
MKRPAIARPLDDEFPSAYAGYVSAAAGDDLFAILDAQMKDLESRAGKLGDEKALYRYEPEKWSIKELLAHVTDSERIFAYRALCIARGDETPLPGFDEKTYAAASMADRRPLPHILGELRALRAATVALFESLDGEALERRGVANTRVVSARALGWVIAGHFAHHMGVLRERYGV